MIDLIPFLAPQPQILILVFIAIALDGESTVKPINNAIDRYDYWSGFG